MCSVLVGTALNPDETGRFSRVSTRLAVSSLLFFRHALPHSHFKIAEVSGVKVPVLDPAEQASRYIIDLIELGLMPAVKQNEVQKVELCIYEATPDTTPATDATTTPTSTTTTEAMGWKIIECHVLNTSTTPPRYREQVPSSLQRLKEAVKLGSAGMTPLPKGVVVGVGLRVSFPAGSRAPDSLHGFTNLQTGIPENAGRLLGLTCEDGAAACEVSVDLTQTCVAETHPPSTSG